jgi:hypothetical protein
VAELLEIEIFTIVTPFSSKKFFISLSCDLDERFKVISLIELLKRSFNEAIFLTLILLVLSSSDEMVFVSVKINDDPSFKLSLFSSKISEKINSSKTLFKSVNFNTA